jgi:pimeloyl-ACP methyl ester carboxylesterase
MQLLACWIARQDLLGILAASAMCFWRAAAAASGSLRSIALMHASDMVFRIPPRSTTPHGAAYVDAGQGEPVVLIHGVGLRLEAWAPQLESLAATHRVIAVDLPGHGTSSPIGQGSGLAEFVDWFTTTLDDLGLDSVNVAGHSMGALIAGGCAVTAPERVRRVALLSAVHCRDRAAASAVMARAAEIAAGKLDPIAPLSRWFGDDCSASEPYLLVKDWLTAVDMEAYATAYGAFAEGDDLYAARWPGVACPALLLTGELDPNSTPQMSRDLAAAAPDAEACIIAGHRHMVNMTAPDEVTTALRHWLTRKA